ncbi:7-cyano-7-deazaguanine synthase QueC [Salinibius halmophilus]|uniref:7-cyano-7-deazaguanine synthase QueC n=1 Tax=Salinibius halmophilus TaxID=1853216 RepID=UPI000E675ED5|nr:7-cyano-7-deazaguanine synthase QueC [Salinibius halmophilus]
MSKAVVLLSGGLDSATCLAIADSKGYDEIHTMSFDYGQRHKAELLAAEKLSEAYGVAAHKVVRLSIGEFGGSALTDTNTAVPSADEGAGGIPVTYVPARNTVFLSIALGYAEVINAQDIYVGVNAVDYSGYPDCRPEFISAFETMANLATKAGVQGNGFNIVAPLQSLTKAEIIRQGSALGLDYAMTVSCYQADAQGRACGTCDSCHLRQLGFEQAGVEDPTNYF